MRRLPILLLLLASAVLAQDRVTLTFVVNAPASTPSGATVFLSGNLAEVGSWRPDAIPLRRGADGRWTAQLALPRGAELLYKFTLGSWTTVEKGPEHEELSNRRLVANADDTVRATVATWRNDGMGDPVTGDSITGDLRVHDGFHSNVLRNDRRLLVWLPPGYNSSAARGYPVLYMHDGQNLFDARTAFGGVEWNADETADRLIRSRRIRALIIVGVENNSDRIEEYTPTADAEYGGGRAADYVTFLVDEVKPFIDRTYRTDPRRETTGIAGSSLGGLVSLYACQTRTDVFSLCGAVSPSLWWDDRRLLGGFASAPDPAFMRRVRWWIDIGTAEGDDPDVQVQNVRDLASVFRAAGLRDGREFQEWEAPGAQHNERAWSQRLDRVLRFLFPR